MIQHGLASFAGLAGLNSLQNTVMFRIVHIGMNLVGLTELYVVINQAANTQY
jgi:hypothetical protein